MMRQILYFLVGLLLWSGSTGSSFAQGLPHCAVLSGSQITGRDLASAIPQLAAIPFEENFGYSPVPGVERRFLPAELQRLAHRFGISAHIFDPVCFTWPMHLLTREEILLALRKSLAGQVVELEIVSQCQMPVPAGELVFPLPGLTAQSSRPAVWNGYVIYARNQKFTTWAQVRVTVHEEQVVSARALHVNELIGPLDIKSVLYVGPLRQLAPIRDGHNVIGKCVKRPIAEGVALETAMLSLPQDVARQQTVVVHTYFGAAHVQTQGIAVEAGYRGDVIKVRNPRTGRIFLGRICEHGVVTVVPGGDTSLVVENKKS